MRIDLKDHFEKTLKNRKTACFVLISCEEPGANGQMAVEMTYEGDPALVGYLLETAQSVVDEQTDEEFSHEDGLRQ